MAAVYKIGKFLSPGTPPLLKKIIKPMKTVGAALRNTD